MPAILNTAIAGPYTIKYGGLDVGAVGPEGIRLRHTWGAEDITGDAHGDSVIEQVYRGGNLFIQVESLERTVNSINAFWPYAALGRMGVIGRLGTAIAKEFKMTAIAGTTASSAPSPSILTFPSVLIEQGSANELLYASRLRRVPLLLRVFPVEDGGVEKWFDTA